MPIQISNHISIEESELHLEFVQTGGPGGQNVNKVASGVELRFDVARSPSLPEDVRQRLAKLAGSRLTQDGVLVIAAHRFRTQEQNRQDALARLVELVQRAALPPRPRKPTRPTAASQERRLESKRRRSNTKRQRRSCPEDG